MTAPTRAQMIEWVAKQKRWVDPENPTRTPQNAAHNAFIDSIVAALGSTEDLCDDGGCREHAYQEYLRGKAEGRGEPVRFECRVLRSDGSQVAGGGSLVDGWRPFVSRESRDAHAELMGGGTYRVEVRDLYAAAPRPTETPK